MRPTSERRPRRCRRGPHGRVDRLTVWSTMTNRYLRRGAAALAGAALLAAAPLAGSPAFAGVPDPLPHDTTFFTPKIPDGARQQIASLTKANDKADASLINNEVSTPQAVWFTDGTPKQVQQQVRQ